MALLEARSVTKSFGSAQALCEASVAFEPGEVHAVLGENGAGKSTLMAVLAGLVRPDSGSILWEGEAVRPGDPVAMKQRGLQMVHQHFMLVPAFSVAENVALSDMGSLNRRLRLDRVTDGVLTQAKGLGWAVDPKRPTESLSVGGQQRVELLKALGQNARALILDEATAVLTPDEAADLYRLVRRLRDEGVAVILIGHKLSEVTPVADRVTVLRHGRVVATSLMAATSTEQVAQWMLGEALTREAEVTPHVERPQRALVAVRDLDVVDNRGAKTVDGLSLDLFPGEILGVGGVDGNGQVELAEAIAGIRPPSSGSVTWPFGAGTTGYIPQDRQGDGLVLALSLEDNLVPAAIGQRELLSGGLLRPRRLRAWAESLLERFGVVPSAPRARAGSLSGGNQQKVVVARALARNPDLLVAVNPTRGLDIRAEAYVHSQIRAAAKAGAAVLLVSTDTDELTLMADRIVYLSRGRVTDHLVGSVA